MNALRRLTTALLLALAMASLAPGDPALAQTGPTSVQYVGESPETFTENVGPGTDAVNDAMSGTAASSASPSASDEASVSPEGATPSSGDADGGTQSVSDADTGEELGSITELPETGGASLATLGSGILLAAFGLMVRRVAE